MRRSDKAARAALRNNKQEHKSTREQRSSAELLREKKQRPKRERDIYNKQTQGRTCHVDIAANDVQARAACVQAFQHGSIQGIRQCRRPRHNSLGVLATEVNAHDHEAREPQAGMLKVDVCHQPRHMFVDLWAMSSTSCGKQATMHWFSSKDKIVSRPQLKHLLHMSLLDGEGVAPQ